MKRLNKETTALSAPAASLPTAFVEADVSDVAGETVNYVNFLTEKASNKDEVLQAIEGGAIGEAYLRGETYYSLSRYRVAVLDFLQYWAQVDDGYELGDKAYLTKAAACAAAGTTEDAADSWKALREAGLNECFLGIVLVLPAGDNPLPDELAPAAPAVVDLRTGTRVPAFKKIVKAVLAASRPEWLKRHGVGLENVAPQFRVVGKVKGYVKTSQRGRNYVTSTASTHTVDAAQKAAIKAWVEAGALGLDDAQSRFELIRSEVEAKA